MKKKLLSLLLVFGLMAGAVGCGKSNDIKNTGTKEEGTQAAEEEPLQKVRLGVMTGGMDHYLAVVGQEQGIFEKYGIDLETTEFAAGINTVDAIVTGQSDLGMVADFAGVNRIGNTQKDCSIRIIGRFTTAKGYSLYVNPEEVTKLEDLAGKGLATNPGTILDYYSALTYEKANIKEEDQKLVNVDSGQAALGVLSNGEAVAYWTTGTTAKKLKEMGMEELLTMEDLGISVEAYYVSSVEFIQEHEETLESFFTAIKETEEWIQANQTEAAEKIGEKTGISKEQVIENLEASELMLDFKQDSVDHLNEIKEWAVNTGLFEENYDITDYIDTTVLKKLFPEEAAY